MVSKQGRLIERAYPFHLDPLTRILREDKNNFYHNTYLLQGIYEDFLVDIAVNKPYLTKEEVKILIKEGEKRLKHALESEEGVRNNYLHCIFYYETRSYSEVFTDLEYFDSFEDSYNFYIKTRNAYIEYELNVNLIKQLLNFIEKNPYSF